MEKLDIASAKQAGFFRRLGVLLYDFLIVLALWFLGTTLALGIVSSLRDIGTHELPLQNSLLFQVYLLLIWLAYYSFSLCKSGQTIGMRAWKVKVVDADFELLNPKACLVRFFTALGGFAYLTCFFTKEQRALNDILSHSFTVRLKTPSKS